MATDDSVVSMFLTNSCRVKAQPNRHKFIALRFHADNETQTAIGSAAELYVEPMISCIANINVLRFVDSTLAVPSRRHVPRRLPVTFASTVNVAEILDGYWPGYATMVKFGELRKKPDTTGNEYMFRLTEINDPATFCFSVEYVGSNGLQGTIPGGVVVIGDSNSVLPVAVDLSVRCLSWPKQAAEWPTRSRKHGWPDAATVATVVDDGCDMISAVHRQCRQNDWEVRHQFRISFPRAETMLLHSWTPVQQLIYHVLRVVVGENGLGRLHDDFGDQILTRRHVKTVMMWSCEKKSRDWWGQHKTLQLCQHLLTFLARCCKSRMCSGYFIERCNLFESDVSLPYVTTQLSRFTDLAFLTEWMINNYVRQCAELCPGDIQMLFMDMTNTRKLLVATNKTVQWRNVSAVESGFRETREIFLSIYGDIMRVSLTAVGVFPATKWIREVSDVDERFRPWIEAVICLKLAPYVTQVDCCYDHVNQRTVAILAGVITNLEMTSPLPTAFRLLRLSTGAHCEGSGVLYQLLAYYHLHQILSGWKPDGTGESAYGLSRLYLAALYHAAGLYSKAVYHCKRYLIATRTLRAQPHVVEAQLLPLDDNAIDSTLGVITLYSYLYSAAMKHSSWRSQLLNVFGEELFCRWLMLTSARKSTARSQRRSRSRRICYIGAEISRCFRELPLVLISDILLFYISTHSTTNSPSRNWTMRFSVAEFRRALLEHSVGLLTSFHETMSRDYHKVCTITTTDYQAMLAYKFGQYEQSLELSRQNANRLMYQSAFLVVPIRGCLTQLMDDDLVSFAAIMTMCGVQKLKSLSMIQLTMSLYLAIQSKLQLGHLVSSVLYDLRQVMVVNGRHSVHNVDERLLLSFVYRKAVFSLRRRQRLS